MAHPQRPAVPHRSWQPILSHYSAHPSDAESHNYGSHPAATAGDSPSHHRGRRKKKHPRPSGWHIAFQSTSARMCEALISQWGEPFDGICQHTIHSTIDALIATDTVLARKRWFQRFTSLFTRSTWNSLRLFSASPDQKWIQYSSE